jgi:hypothetical protein
MIKIDFKKTNKIPKSRNFGGISERTADCIKELSAMEVNDIVHLPIIDSVEKELQKRTCQQYVGSIETARKHLLPREYKVARRGNDIFIRRFA